jgi:2-aminoethylphosphonate-pyruvate transaminase
MTTNKLLFTPGPLTTSDTVKSAMLRDAGSRDADFLAVVRSIRDRLLAIGGAAPGGAYECVLMQGSGTFAIESVISSAIPRDGRLLVAVNGAYGCRIAQIACVHGIEVETLDVPENRKVTAAEVGARLAASIFTHVAVIHCETTTGIVNPIEEIGAVVSASGATFIVDAMSSFGAIPISLEGVQADFLISSANKCIEGVPGFGFILARRDALLAAKGRARTLSLDLHAQWAGLETDGQFRFTPPTHVLLAFQQALDEFDAEGGVEGRAARYRRNYETLARGMEELGFEHYLAPEDRGYIITTYRYPTWGRPPGLPSDSAGQKACPTEGFRFEEFYTRLSDLGFIIYPGKLSQEPCFRIGTIGRLEVRDIEALLRAIGQVMSAMVPDAEATGVSRS